MTLKEVREAALPACERFGVRRLDAFGSLARGDAVSGSDVDLLVEFSEPAEALSKRFFGLLHHLEDMLGCKIDLVTADGLANPYFRKRVLSERKSIYGG